MSHGLWPPSNLSGETGTGWLSARIGMVLEEIILHHQSFPFISFPTLHSLYTTSVQVDTY